MGVYDSAIESFRNRGRFAIKGVSDIIAVYKGITFYLEVKSEKGKQSKHQKAFQMAIERNGALYFIVRSIEDAKDAIKSVYKFYELS